MGLTCHSLWMTESKRVHACFVGSLHRVLDAGTKVNIINSMDANAQVHSNTSNWIPLEYSVETFPHTHAHTHALNAREIENGSRYCGRFAHFRRIVQVLNKRRGIDSYSGSPNFNPNSFIHSARLHCVFHSMTRKISNYTWFYGPWFLTSWYPFDTFSPCLYMFP